VAQSDIVPDTLELSISKFGLTIFLAVLTPQRAIPRISHMSLFTIYGMTRGSTHMCL